VAGSVVYVEVEAWLDEAPALDVGERKCDRCRRQLVQLTHASASGVSTGRT
jgi:hypothetical protein